MFYVLEAVNIGSGSFINAVYARGCDQTTAIQSTDGICAI